MFDYLKIILHIITLTAVFFIQLSFWQSCQITTPHFLLILYLKTLYNQESSIKLFYLAFLSELISFIQTDFTGLTLILLIPLSILLKKIKKYFHIQIIAPCIIIILFCILYAFLSNFTIHIKTSFNTLIQQIIINCLSYAVISFKKHKKKSYTR